jgi:hypothetical protein
MTTFVNAEVCAFYPESFSFGNGVVVRGVYGPRTGRIAADEAVFECGVGIDVGRLKIVHIDIVRVDEAANLLPGGRSTFLFI